ncbi:hypothetical protein BCR42DRAFT_492398 [Absidia repens]|uniref:Concanavalin A-like lectin/glucanase domain-containing protein n=1 Tax=Absidia repens TaxID=90262 RepID=A0A1X2IDP8_9FUNG|nr:hypothetical protein BCR42DRAFT_492398 [Absidia repens]
MITTSHFARACVDPVDAYHATFPVLHSFPWQKDDLKNSPLARKRRHSILGSTRLETSWTPPPYLLHTHYAALVREQHQARLQKRNDNDKKLWMNNDSSSSRSHLISLCINPETADRLATLDLRLPSIMSSTDKSRYLEIDKDGLGVNYVGPGRSEDHAGTVRANLPIPIQCGVYYYEMHVKSKGDDGYIGIGFCSARNELKRLPGWDKLSYGYHGDDGHKFEGSGIGKKYGPQFQAGVAFQQLDLSHPIYPCIGMRTQNEYVVVNFGQDPFVYDIVQYIQEQKMTLWKDITSYSIPTSAILTSPASVSDKENINPLLAAEYSNNTSPSMDQLISSYMIHHGYSSSAAALKKNSVYLAEPNSVNHDLLGSNDEEDKDDDNGLQQRLAVKNAVVRGDIDQAIELLGLYFPSILRTTKNIKNDKSASILFQLKCQKFVEMIGAYDIHVGHHDCSSVESADDAFIESRNSSSSSISSSSNNQEDQQVFSLLAYPNPSSSPMGHLLEKSNRELLASEINVAILVHQNRPEISALDCVYRQLLAVNKELIYLGHGHSAFLNLTSD